MRFHFPDYNPTGSYAAEGQAHPLSAAHRALAECQKAGTIAEHVSFKTCDTRGRRGTGIALEIQLEATRRDRGRRAGNTGSYGASTGYGGDGLYAATYDEWGFFIAALYRIATEENGPGAFFCGSASYKVYADETDFHKLSRYLYSESQAAAKRLAEWLADDPEDEKRCEVELAEQEYRIPFVISAVRAALRPLGTDARKRVLAEVE